LSGKLNKGKSGGCSAFSAAEGAGAAGPFKWIAAPDAKIFPLAPKFNWPAAPMLIVPSAPKFIVAPALHLISFVTLRL